MNMHAYASFMKGICVEAFLVGETSGQLFRHARYGDWPRIHSCQKRCVAVPEDCPRAQWWREVMSELEPYITIDEGHPLELCVPSRDKRIRTKQQDHLVDCHIVTGTLPKGSFLRLELETGTSLYIQSPAYSFAWYARQLEAIVQSGTLTYEQGRAILQSYGYELCGTYALDARDSNEEAHYFLQPATTTEEIIAWCKGALRRKGAFFALECATTMLDGSGSPRETFHSIMLTSCADMGGVGLGDALLNHPINVSSELRRAFHRWPMRPDLQFPEIGLFIEHLGPKHGEATQFMEDALRAQDYSAAGALLYPTTKEDFESAAAYDRFLRRVGLGLLRRPDANAQHAGSCLLSLLDDRQATKTRWSVFDVQNDRMKDYWQPRLVIDNA